MVKELFNKVGIDIFNLYLSLINNFDMVDQFAIVIVPYFYAKIFLFH